MQVLASLLGSGADRATWGSCDFCHLCSRPLGYCLLWWAAAALIVLIVLTAVIGRKRRCPQCGARVKRSMPVCRSCGYDLRSGEVSPVGVGSAEDMFADRHLREFPVRVVPDVALEEDEPAAAPAPSAAAEPAAEPEPEAAAPVSVESDEPPILPPGRTCPSCGARLPQKAMFCAECGRRLS